MRYLGSYLVIGGGLLVIAMLALGAKTYRWEMYVWIGIAISGAASTAIWQKRAASWRDIYYQAQEIYYRESSK